MRLLSLASSTLAFWLHHRGPPDTVLGLRLCLPSVWIPSNPSKYGPTQCSEGRSRTLRKALRRPNQSWMTTAMELYPARASSTAIPSTPGSSAWPENFISNNEESSACPRTSRLIPRTSTLAAWCVPDLIASIVCFGSTNPSSREDRSSQLTQRSGWRPTWWSVRLPLVSSRSRCSTSALSTPSWSISSSTFWAS